MMWRSSPCVSHCFLTLLSSGSFALLTERLDEMLASQESMLRSHAPEADYRAATVKQRPTSRRITPAEISVSTPIQRSAPCYKHNTYHISMFCRGLAAVTV